MTQDQSTGASTINTSKGSAFAALGSGKDQFLMVRGMHQAYARALGTTLSAFLGTDIQAALVQVATTKAASFVSSLSSPSCLIMFRLRPLSDHMFLHMDCATVFPLLELLLGGKSDTLSDVTQRHLTEVEWSLLEEIVKVMVRPLGEAWKSLASVEFEVDSLVSEPGLLPAISAAHSFLHLTFELVLGKNVGKLQIVVPESFFDAAEPGGEQLDRPAGEMALSHLRNALVDIEVFLEGPSVAFRDLMALQANWVLRLDYALDRPLRAVLNDQLALEGRIVSVGRKRGFCITALPEA